jgi:hypothetical protein
MDTKEKQGIIAVTTGILLLILSMIASAMFAERIPYGEYIFTATSLGGLVLMFVGMRKIMQHTVSTR